MVGAQFGADGTMSDSGWVNGEIFEGNVKTNLAKHCYLDSVSSDRPATLILYDGHKSYLSLTLNEWARGRNVIFFVLTPHTSHLTQQLDVGDNGPFKSFYYTECQQYLQNNQGVFIPKYEIDSLTSKTYMKAFSPSNIPSAFKKSGIYLFDESQIANSDTSPSSIYSRNDSSENHEQCQGLD
ncbi:uncharacterized protein LOC132743443 [Ruditapes philippinarum]|uniref:uncharacterized protein LOC132743443 n=1 Tax=Ruditapes philippinarum TaxID=129788 RepID=UPI00295AEEDE|nr:uncharacterized protein LOC132743443 [Ruditapes philippinarum]